MSEFILQIEKLISAIGDPEYRFLLLEPLILFGVVSGAILMTVSLFIKAPKLQIAALVTLGVSAFMHTPYLEARQSAQPRIEQVYKISSPARVKGFKENTGNWIAKAWQFKLLFLVAVITFLIGVNRNKIGFWLAISSVVLGLVAAKNAMWLHYQDALAYHPNLKTHEAPIDKKVVSTPPSTAKKEGKSYAAKPSPAPKPQPKPSVKSITPKPVSSVPPASKPATSAPAVQPLSAPSPVRQLSAPAPPRSSYPRPSGYDSSRIPAPEVPLGKAVPSAPPAPRARAVQPLPRY